VVGEDIQQDTVAGKRPRTLRVRRPGLPALVAAIAFAVALWLLWGHWAMAVLRDGNPVTGTIKEYFLADQLTYLSIAQNAQAGHGIGVEPFTLSGHSVYPSAYYWLLGVSAKLLGVTTFGTWNLFGILSSVALLLAGGAFGRWATRSAWGWVAGAFPVLIGTLLWYTDGTWRTQFGAHAQLWAPNGVLYSPGAETPSLVLCLLSVLALSIGLSDPRRRLAGFVVAGACAGAIINLHTYVFLLTVALLAAFLLADRMLDAPTRAQRWTVVATAVVTAAVLLSGLAPEGLGSYALALAACAVPLLALGAWRRRLLVPALAMTAAALITAAPQLVRFIADIGREDSFLRYRQEDALDVPLSLPAGQVLLHTAPLLVAVAVAIAVLWRRRDAHGRVWLAALLAVLVAGGVLVFNAGWGMKQEPYRFYPYTFALLAIIAGAVLVGPGSLRPGVRVAALAALAVTLPTTVVFYTQTAGLTIRFFNEERIAFDQIADTARDAGGLAYIDSCMPGRAMTSLSDINTADISRGTALPAKPDPGLLLQLGTYQFNANRVPPRDLLRDAGVGSFVTLNTCPLAAEAANRFGRPVELELSHAAALGVPPTLRYLVFSTARDRG
jgi:hypothetical protein